MTIQTALREFTLWIEDQPLSTGGGDVQQDTSRFYHGKEEPGTVVLSW